MPKNPKIVLFLIIFLPLPIFVNSILKGHASKNIPRFSLISDLVTIFDFVPDICAEIDSGVL